MTLANNYNPTRQLANGVTTSFSFTYDMINSDYATVYQEIDGVQTIVDSGLYTVEFDTNGGNVIFKTPPAAGTYIVIGRDVPLDQIVPYRTSSGFPANRVEENLDKLTAITQQLSNESDRSPKIPIGLQNINMNLPAPSAGKALVWNENGNAIVNSTDEFNNIVTDATAQANIATQKATEASNSALAAANSASVALTSETNAETSAEQAATSESNAASSAAAALASQNAAAASENLAQQWATKTDGMVNNEDYSAKYYASQSQASATASANSASAALSSQTAAANSASAALTSETNAETSAEQAATSAGNAATSENNAASSASAALNSQNAAASSAELAQEAAQKASFDNIGDIKYTSRTDVPNGGVWCDGAEYTQAQFPDVYQMLVDGKLSSTDYSIFNNSVSTNGYCALFALDSSAQKFKVPKLLDKYVMDLADDVPVVGNGMALGISGVDSDVVTRYLLSGGTYPGVDRAGLLCASSVNGLVGDTGSEDNFTGNTLVGLTTDPEKSGMIADTSNLGKTVTLKAYVVLYSSAAEASEVADTDLSNVSSNIDYVVEQGEINNITWEKWKSGKLIQRGSIITSQNATITFPKPYANTDYAAFMTPRRSDNTTTPICAIQNTTMSTTSMVCLAGDRTSSLSWMTIGQGA